MGGICTELTSTASFASPVNRYSEATNVPVHDSQDKSPVHEPSNPHAELGNRCF